MYQFFNRWLASVVCLGLSASSLLGANSLTNCKHEQFECDFKSKQGQIRKYFIFNFPSTEPGGQTLLTGIREVDHKQNQVFISGFYNAPDGVTVIPFVYKGSLAGEGTWNILNYPSSPGTTVNLTNLYGPNNGPKSTIQVVGNYTTVETGSKKIGCLYEGPLNGSGKWTSLIPTSKKPVLDTIAHSTMGGLVVGNYNTQEKISQAFIYEIKTGKYYRIIKPKAKDITAYGIWHNGGHSYTICGGYSNLNATTGVGSAYLVDWDNKTKKFSNWRSYDYGNDPVNAIVTHFDGITSNGCGGYNLTGDWTALDHPIEQGFYCEIKRKHAKWFLVSYPGRTITSGNSIYKKAVIGSYANLEDFSVNGYISIPRDQYSE